MPYTPVAVEQFRGLQLANDRDEQATGALQCKNIRVDSSDRLRVREGYVARNTGGTARTPLGFGLYHQGNQWLIPFTGGLRVIAVGPGYGISDFTATTGYSGAMAETTAQVLLARTTGVLAIFAGGAPSTLALSPWCKFLARQPQESRLVAGYAGIGALHSSRVHFSNAGNFAVWTSTDWVDLRPDDGESIRAVVTWGDQVFVFKETSFFVFYGNSVDSTGNSVFNFRPIDTGIGVAQDFGAVAGPDGVYFLSGNGVYRTAGGNPELVSRDIQRLFDGDPPAGSDLTLTTPAVDGRSAQMCTSKRALYVVDTSQSVVWVYAFATGQWSVNSYANVVTTLLTTPTPGDMPFADSTGRVYETGNSVLLDDATAIAARYRTGFTNFGTETKFIVREVRVTGVGTVSVGASKDWDPSAPSTTSVPLGTVTPTPARYRVAARGNVLAYQYDLVNAAATTGEIDSLVYQLADRRVEDSD